MLVPRGRDVAAERISIVCANSAIFRFCSRIILADSVEVPSTAPPIDRSLPVPFPQRPAVIPSGPTPPR